MAGPWEKYGQQSSAITATPLPRNPYDVERDQREAARDSRAESRDQTRLGESLQGQDFTQTKAFRDEFRALPSVTEYNIALGTFNAARNTEATPEGDQSLITAFARMMDPDSVVREGEFATAAGNESIFKRLRATFAKEFGMDGAGRLTASGRERLREEMRNLVNNRFRPPYEIARQQYSRFAEMSGFDPYMVVGEPAEAAFGPELATVLDEAPTESTMPRNIADVGAREEAVELPQAYQDAHYAYLKQNWGKLDPEAYAQFRSGLDERYDLTADPAAYRDFAPEANDVANSGGQPSDLGVVPPPTERMGNLEAYYADSAQTPTGAFLANAGNALAAGLPARLSGNQDRLRDIRDINPVSSFAGEVAGGIGGTIGAGAGLNAIGRGSSVLANLGYGTTYGATQDDNPFRGAMIGGAAAFGGDALGRSLGSAFPTAFNRSGIRAADETVPSGEQLQRDATALYQQAEANGITAEPEAVNDMIGRAARILRDNGALTPRDNITAGTDVSRGMTMLSDFADTPMTPTQAGSVRKLLGEGRTAMKDGVPDYNQRRIAGEMLDEFDAWAEPALPGVEEARSVAQRAILGREMERANELATGPQAAQFTQSGEENALRSVYRGLDRSEIRGRNAYPEELTAKIQEVSRGTPFSNAMRALGKFAPNSAVSALPAIGAAGVGASALGPIGTAAGLGVAGAGLFGRSAATRMTQRAAQEAELIARGGPEYAALLEEAKKLAAMNAGTLGRGIAVAPASAATR